MTDSRLHKPLTLTLSPHAGRGDVSFSCESAGVGIFPLAPGNGGEGRGEGGDRAAKCLRNYVTLNWSTQ